MGPGFNAVCVVREEQNYKSDPPSHGSEGRRKTEGEKRKERGEGGRPSISDGIILAQGLGLGLCIHPPFQV